MSLTEQLEDLSAYYKENRDDFNDNFRLKIHRTLSWLKKANEEENLDFKFYCPLDCLSMLHMLMS